MKTMRVWLLISGLFALPSGVFAQYTLAYSTNDGVITLTGYSGTPVDATIPSFVSAVGADAFWGCASLESVTIPTSVTAIGVDAFYGCTSLKSAALPDSVTAIGDYAFYNCSLLTNVTIPDSVTTIGSSVFIYCYGLTNVTLGKSVSAIGNCAFGYCINLPSVAIPDSVTTIGSSAFADCFSLASVSIGDSVSAIGMSAFVDCTNLASVYFSGDAPPPDPDCSTFGGDPATIYYVAGTSGWASTFDCLPTEMWNPPLQPANGSLGSFGFTITGPANIPIIVQVSSNLSSGVWSNVQSCNVTNGSIYFTDPDWTNYPGRFYRVAYPYP